jgi:type I restriction enzyme, S subunit
MTREDLFKKFEVFAEEPGAVATIRELILRLAFSGGLSGYRTSEPAELPGWESRTINSICSSITPGFACSKSHQVERGHVHLRTHNISTLGSLNFDLLVRIEPSKVDPTKAAIRRGDILFNNTNSQELVGKTSLVDRDYPYSFSNHITRLRVQEDVDPAFVVYYFTLLRNSGYFASICTRWINQAAVNTETLKRQLILLPPIAEQKRIVTKVDELMTLCDRLEAQQKEREARHGALVRASLARFADAPTPTNLTFLFHKAYAIAPAELRKSILSVAVQGKLVPQQPDDEPADVLIARIDQDRPKLASAQGVRPPKNVPRIAEENLPYEVPESWRWSRLGHLALVIDYGTSQKADRNSLGVPVYRMGNIVGGRLVDENLKYVRSSIDDLPALYLKNGDLLFNRTNSYELVGKVGMFTGPDDVATFASYLIRIRLPSTLLSPAFYAVAMNAPYFRQTQIEPEVVQQCGQANFNGTKLACTVVPVPPLPEQHRIVSKVDQLMTLVDELEAQLACFRATSTKLLDAIVGDLTA